MGNLQIRERAQHRENKKNARSVITSWREIWQGRAGGSGGNEVQCYWLKDRQQPGKTILLYFSFPAISRISGLAQQIHYIWTQPLHVGTIQHSKTKATVGIPINHTKIELEGAWLELTGVKWESKRWRLDLHMKQYGPVERGRVVCGSTNMGHHF